jgi:hypothetical protein
MAGAIAMGKRLGVKNMALSVARSALPGGAAMRAAFDAGIGIAQAGRLDASALQKVRDQLPRGEAVQAAFNTALAVARAKPGSFTGAFNALKSSLPSNEIGQQLARVAQQTLKRRGLTFDKSIAFKAAQEIAQRVRDGDQAARSRVMDLVQRAKQGDAAAQAATDMLRKIVETGPIAVASHGAVRMAEQAAQMAPALPALPPIPEPEELPGLDAQSTDQDTDPVDAQSSGEDGTDALIESMGGRGAARCPSCGHCASAAA